MKRILNALISATLCLVLLFSFTACGEKSVKGTVTLDKEKMLLVAGQEDSLTATFTPNDETADITKVVITWSSSRPAVVTVDETGKVTAKAQGKAEITATYGKASATCEVEVYDTENRETVEAEDPRINISNHQNKMTINLKKSLGYLYEDGDVLVEILDGDGQSVPFTLSGNVATVDWSGDVGMHTWLFCTKYKVISAEVCHATHIIAKIEDFGPLSSDWDVATAGNTPRNPRYQNATKDWYVVLDANINALGGEDLSYKNTYSFGRNYAIETTFDQKGNVVNDHYFAVFNGTFDGRGYSITGLNTEAGFIANLGTTGVIKNLALLDARNGRNYSSGVLGIYGLGKVENVFIEGYLKEWSGWSSGMYIRVETTNQLEVKDCLVILRLYYSSWPNAAVQMPAFFGAPLQKNPVKITNSFGISEHLTQVDGAGTNPNGMVYRNIKEWIAAGGYAGFRGLWEIAQNSIFFGGQQVYSWED